MSEGSPPYAAFFCEENVWHLARWPGLPEGRRNVLFVSNPGRSVALWQQRAAPAPEEPVVWDYHVILAVDTERGTRIFDLDCTLGLDLDAREYLRATFLRVPPAFAPRFRLIEASTFVEQFASDRRHMRDPTGAPLQPFPPWPEIGQGHNLEQFLDMQAPFLGEVLDLEALHRRIR